jgi:hypothetical protein
MKDIIKFNVYIGNCGVRGELPDVFEKVNDDPIEGGEKHEYNRKTGI